MPENPVDNENPLVNLPSPSADVSPLPTPKSPNTCHPEKPIQHLSHTNVDKALMRHDPTFSNSLKIRPNSLTKGDLFSFPHSLPNQLQSNLPPLHNSILGPIPRTINLSKWANITNIQLDQKNSPITQLPTDNGGPVDFPFTLGSLNTAERNLSSVEDPFETTIPKKPKNQIPKLESLTLNPQFSPQIETLPSYFHSDPSYAYPSNTEPINIPDDFETIHINLKSPTLVSYNKKVCHIKRNTDGSPSIQRIHKPSITISEVPKPNQASHMEDSDNLPSSSTQTHSNFLKMAPGDSLVNNMHSDSTETSPLFTDPEGSKK